MAMQSVADATVSVRALMTTLFLRLAPGLHELIVFDVNRHAEVNALMNRDAAPSPDSLLNGAPLNFKLSVLRNAGADSQRIEIAHRLAGASAISRESTTLAWPPLVYSLSHVALPFAPDDPIYGAEVPRPLRAIYLGRPNLLGERGLLAIPAGDLIRLRFNPFFDYMEQRIEAFLQMHSPRIAAAHALERNGPVELGDPLGGPP
ncbi:MAG: hypothetical protein LUO80_10150 [Methylococcaceae bacterium]|nr:hypothetical protein [Methylococcaceae bacterium]